ncbi:DUF4421 family protein [Chryseobacterium cucumeris]|uniref:DUF4421 family protein n=1 Tax=Chryseobacterium TaxID=59732 RepID=UPI002883161E|nr:DUF4421 family protein [Chryseobacterium sp. SG20098]WNI36454.1 DUF4421 family protein [Chryseobacterium sp. SG20098]
MKFLSVCIFLFPLTLFSQFPKLKTNFEKDSSYVKRLNEHIVLKIVTFNRANNFNVKNNDVFLNIIPNDSQKYSLSVDYDFLAFSIDLPERWTNTEPDNEKKGRTTRFDAAFTIFRNYWMQSLYYNQTKGFYIKNTKDFSTEWMFDLPYMQFPDFKVTNVGGSTSYVVNAQRISFRAVNNQTEIQRKSAGSLIVTTNYNYSHFSNKEEDLKSTQNRYNIIPEISYQYNWVLLNCDLLLSGKLGSGYGFSYVQNTFNGYRNNYGTDILYLNLNLNINYQFKNLFLGSQYHISFQNYNDNGFTVNNSMQYLNVFLGYRFDAPKILKKNSNWIKTRFFFLK